jgi:hypothetical protein
MCILLLSLILAITVLISPFPIIDHPDNAWCKVQIIKSLSQHPVLNHHQSVMFSYGETKVCINKRTWSKMYIKCNTVPCSHYVYTLLAALEQPSTTSSKTAPLRWLDAANSNKTYSGLHVKHLTFVPDFNQFFGISQQIFIKPPI